MENKIYIMSDSEIYSILVLVNFEYISTGQPTFNPLALLSKCIWKWPNLFFYLFFDVTIDGSRTQCNCVITDNKTNDLPQRSNQAIQIVMVGWTPVSFSKGLTIFPNTLGWKKKSQQHHKFFFGKIAFTWNT